MRKMLRAVLAAALMSGATALPAFAQMATIDSLPSDFTRFAGKIRSDHTTIVVPPSSMAKPGDAGVRAHTNTRLVFPDATSSVHAAPAGNVEPYTGNFYETPATLNCVYLLNATSGGCNPDGYTTNAAGGAKAVAIVDAYHYPHALTDLQAYSKQFGLVVPTSSTFVQVNLGGSSNTDDGWGSEAALDVQMAHAVAPKAKIYLVEAASNGLTDLLAAVSTAKTLVANAGGGQVSMSWGSDEFSTEANYDGYFAGTNVVYFASTGDDVTPQWPAVSSKVVAVGGTSISRNPSTGAWMGEQAWSEAGAGYSRYIARPSWQPSTVGTKRGVPDISAVANPATGVWVYFTPAATTSGGWYIIGGTSVSSPLMAGIVNASGHFRASTAAELTAIYSAKTASASSFRTQTRGYCGAHAAYTISTAWNPCTGVGSPKSTTYQ